MKLVVGVSGGIDSVVLLDKLVHEKKHDIVVAHVDHGIREDSAQDAALVQRLAEKHGLQYAETNLQLGQGASEERARDERYAWLRKMKEQYGAEYIATAHHQDDVIETMIINLIRGTGWRGLSVMGSGSDIIRPLIDTSKAEIISYAIDHNLEWRDDSTNDDVRYLRNYVRYRYAQRMRIKQRQQWLSVYKKQLLLRDEIDREVVALLPNLRSKEGYSRYSLIMIDQLSFSQIIQAIVGTSLEQSTITQLRHFVCTARPEKMYVQGGARFRVTTRDLIVSTSDIC